ncbi:sof1-like domain-containing protein [Ditylenchus destructor]|uniref:Sof1-like domain-containing protein n=1 Tax=Ditylenchus destructor TaxID=166010 RepID=A0AAD4R6R5_9BILA|nr:sof1-like domain-containing protein [Ditylenchus destructor]
MDKIARIKVISRNPDEYQRETKFDIHKATRNYKANADPFRHQIEYTRALNGAKLQRLLAKPFLAALDGHNEAVHLLEKHPSRLSTILSGARDGQVKVWHLTTKRCLQTVQAHNGPINGMSIDNENGQTYVTVGQDSQLKIWDLPELVEGEAAEPTHSIPLDSVPHSVSHIANSTDFVTCGEGISVWKALRDSPVRTYDLGPNTIQNIRCNPIEDSVIAGCASDRSIFLLDSRQKEPLTRVVLKLRSNSVAWNPMESYTFTAANEDYNLYTFDMRYLDSARNVHQGHTAAVMDVDYAPSGQEFVSGSYDRSIRIFNVEAWKSREVYHAPRMQMVLSVLYTLDNKYIVSGSDEMNIRLWKSNASEKLGPLKHREKVALEYSSKLLETYQHHPEIKRIVKHRHVPKQIYSAAKEHSIIRESQKRKQDNLRKHTKKPMPYVPERKKPIVKQGIDE